MEKTPYGEAADSALARIIDEASLPHPLTRNGLPLKTKVDYSQLASKGLFYIRVKRDLLKKNIWPN